MVYGVVLGIPLILFLVYLLGYRQSKELATMGTGTAVRVGVPGIQVAGVFAAWSEVASLGAVPGGVGVLAAAAGDDRRPPGHRAVRSDPHLSGNTGQHRARALWGQARRRPGCTRQLRWSLPVGNLDPFPDRLALPAVVRAQTAYAPKCDGTKGTFQPCPSRLPRSTPR